MDEERRICDVEDVPEDSTLLFTVRNGFDEEEAILTKLDDGVVAYANYCQHWTDVRFDKGSGALVRDGELVCQTHGATFQTDSGFCDFGPCEGAVLPDYEVTVADDGVYLTDDDYEFVELGTSKEHDLSTSPGERLGM